MAIRETSDELSSLAGKILNEPEREGDEHLSFNALLKQAKRLAGSVLSQDETAGAREDYKPAAGTSAYEMVAASETAHVQTTETLIHMVAATVLAVLIDEEGGGRTNVSFSPAEMDSMHQRYMLDAKHDGLITTVSITPREGAFPNGMTVRTAPAKANAQDDPPESFYADQGIDTRDAKPQAEEHVFDRPLWAARIDGTIYPASDRKQAERAVATRLAEEPDTIAQVENRFCYHDDCPADRCMKVADVPDQDGDEEVTSGS